MTTFLLYYKHKRTTNEEIMNILEKLITINEKIGNYAFKPLPEGTERFVVTYLKRIRKGLYNTATLRYANFFINKI